MISNSGQMSDLACRATKIDTGFTCPRVKSHHIQFSVRLDDDLDRSSHPTINPVRISCFITAQTDREWSKNKLNGGPT